MMIRDYKPLTELQSYGANVGKACKTELLSKYK